MSPRGTAKGDEKEAEEVVNGVPFTSQWSFLVSRSSSPFQEISVGGYLQAPPFIIIPAPFVSFIFLLHYCLRLRP